MIYFIQILECIYLGLSRLLCLLEFFLMFKRGSPESLTGEWPVHISPSRPTFLMSRFSGHVYFFPPDSHASSRCGPTGCRSDSITPQRTVDPRLRLQQFTEVFGTEDIGNVELSTANNLKSRINLLGSFPLVVSWPTSHSTFFSFRPRIIFSTPRNSSYLLWRVFQFSYSPRPLVDMLALIFSHKPRQRWVPWDDGIWT